jgi:hypothetical protein
MPSPWDVPLFGQHTPQLCWEACARMMYAWKYSHLWPDERERQYARAAGGVLQLGRGLSEAEMDVFYRLGLGMRSLPEPKGANVRQALQWSPVVIVDRDEAFGHAMVVAHHETPAGVYWIRNPCGVQELTEAAMTCDATHQRTPAAEVDPNLGRFIWYW